MARLTPRHDAGQGVDRFGVAKAQAPPYRDSPCRHGVTPMPDERFVATQQGMPLTDALPHRNPLALPASRAAPSPKRGAVGTARGRRAAPRGCGHRRGAAGTGASQPSPGCRLAPRSGTRPVGAMRQRNPETARRAKSALLDQRTRRRNDPITARPEKNSASAPGSGTAAYIKLPAPASPFAGT